MEGLSRASTRARIQGLRAAARALCEAHHGDMQPPATLIAGILKPLLCTPCTASGPMLSAFPAVPLFALERSNADRCRAAAADGVDTVPMVSLHGSVDVDLPHIVPNVALARDGTEEVVHPSAPVRRAPWQAGSELMACRVGFASPHMRSPRWVSFQGLATAVPEEVAAALDATLADSADADSAVSARWLIPARARGAAAPVACRAAVLGMIVRGLLLADELPAIWWFYVWLHRNHSIRWVLQPARLASDDGALRWASYSSRSPRCHPLECQVHRIRDRDATSASASGDLVPRSVADADALGMLPMLLDMQSAEPLPPPPVRVARPRKSRRRPLSSAAVFARLRATHDHSAHDTVLTHIGRNFARMSNEAFAALVREYRVFLHSVDYSTALQMEAEGTRARASIDATMVVQRQRSNRGEIELPIAIYRAELRRWLDWRLVYGFFPSLGMRTALLASGVPFTTRGPDSPREVAIPRHYVSISATAALPKSASISRGSIPPVPVGEVHGFFVLAHDRGLGALLRWSDVDRARLSDARSAFWTFRAALPALDATRFWKHFAVAPSLCVPAFDALDGLAKGLFDAVPVHRAAGSRRSDPRYAFVYQRVSQYAELHRREQAAESPKFVSSLGRVVAQAHRDWAASAPAVHASFLDAELIHEVFPDFKGLRPDIDGGATRRLFDAQAQADLAAIGPAQVAETPTAQQRVPAKSHRPLTLDAMLRSQNLAR